MTGDPVGDLLVAVAGQGLAGAPSLPAAPIDDDDAADLLDRARAERVVGLLDDSVATGALAVSATTAGRVGDAAVEVASGALVVERHTLTVHRLLTNAGVDHRFLKGVTTAHRFGGHPALRSFADVDVLVQGDDLDRVVTVLLAAGHDRTQAEWRPGFAASYGKSVTLRSAGGVEVDLHRVFASGPFGLAGDVGSLWRRPACGVTVGGVELPCLDPATTFVHACVHAVTGQRPTLATLRDVARILPSADPTAVSEVEQALRVEGCTTTAVELAATRLHLGADPARDRLRARPVRRLERAWLRQYGPSDHRFRRLALIGITAVPTVRGKLAYAWALARP